MTIKNRGGVFGRNPTFNDVDVDGTLSVGGAAIPAPANTAKLDTAQTFTATQIFPNVGIGASPTQNLHIKTDSPRILLTDTDTNSNCFLDANSGSGSFEVSIDDNNVSSNSSFIIKIDGGEKARFISTGGITFNGDTAAANALDDYEEGTWTPTFTASGATFSYTSQFGIYTKIGRQVTATFTFLASASGTLTNPISISSFPFTSSSTGSQSYSGMFGFSNTTTLPLIVMNPSSTSAPLTFEVTAGDATPSNLGMSSSKWLKGSIVYFTD